MSNQIYRKSSYVVFSVRKGFVVYNTAKPFSKGHTHIQNYKMAVNIITFAMQKVIPTKVGNYILVSLTRVSNDKKYIQDIQNLMEIRKQKGKENCIKVKQRRK